MRFENPEITDFNIYKYIFFKWLYVKVMWLIL